MIFRSGRTTLSTANSGQQQIPYCYERTPDLPTPWNPTPFTLPNPPARGHREQAQVSRALVQHGDGRRWPSAGMMQCSAPQCAMRWCSDGSTPTSNFQGSQSVSLLRCSPTFRPRHLLSAFTVLPTPALSLSCPSETTSFPFMSTCLFHHFASLQPSTLLGSGSSSRP